MSFSFGQATTTAGSTFGSNTPTDNKPSLFGSPQTSTPAFGGFSFGEAKTTTAASNLFSTPPTTQTAFGANKPLSFGGFTSPPVQTVGSPGFGQTANTPNAENKPQSAFSTPPTQAPAFGQPSPGALGGSNFSFGKSGSFNFTTPATGFVQPQPTATTTTATTTQSFNSGNKPAFGTSFGNKPFGATAAAPAFGTTTPSTGFSFGQAPRQQQPQTTQNQSFPFSTQNQTPTFGAPTAQSLSFGSPQTQSQGQTQNQGQAQNFSNQPTQATTQNTFLTQPQAPAFSTQPSQALNFSKLQTPAVSFGQTSQPITTQANLNFGTSTQAATQPTSFGASTQPTSFGTTTQPTSFGTSTQPNSFGTSTQPTSFGTSAQPTSFGTSTQPTAFGTSTQPPSFGTSTQPSAFGASTQPPAFGTSTQPTSTFGTSAPASTFSTTQTTQANLSFGATQVTQANLSFGKTPATQTQSLSFATTSVTSSFATTSTLSFGGNQTSQVITTASTTQSFAFATTTSSFGLTSGLSFGKTTSTTAATTSTTAPSGITILGKTTAAMPTLTTATTTTASAPPAAITSISFAQLEENINKWSIELTEQENNFIKQATMINAWDRLLVANGEKILELNDAVETVKNEQQSLEHELDFILAQQKELEELLKPLEKQLLEDSSDRMRDPEREHMYTLAETLDTQLRQMSEDLKEVIEHLNETNRSQDSNDPIVQIGRILNAHMSSMQWVESSAALISGKLDALRAEHAALRRHNETAFHLAYN